MTANDQMRTILGLCFSSLTSDWVVNTGKCPPPILGIILRCMTEESRTHAGVMMHE